MWGLNKKRKNYFLVNIWRTDNRKNKKNWQGGASYSKVSSYDRWIWFLSNRLDTWDHFLQIFVRVRIPDHLFKSSPDFSIWYYIGICTHDIRIIAMKKREHRFHEITCTMSRPVYKERLGISAWRNRLYNLLRFSIQFLCNFL